MSNEMIATTSGSGGGVKRHREETEEECCDHEHEHDHEHDAKRVKADATTCELCNDEGQHQCSKCNKWKEHKCFGSRPGRMQKSHKTCIHCRDISKRSDAKYKERKMDAIIGARYWTLKIDAKSNKNKI